jgi:hypothetical protein
MAVEQAQEKVTFFCSMELFIDGTSILFSSKYSCAEHIQNSVMKLFREAGNSIANSELLSTKLKCAGPSPVKTSMEVQVEVMRVQ